MNVYNHRYVHNYKYASLLKTLPRSVIYLTYNGQLYKLERNDDTDPNAPTESGFKVLSKLVKDFTNIGGKMISVEEFYENVIKSLKSESNTFFE